MDSTYEEIEDVVLQNSIISITTILPILLMDYGSESDRHTVYSVNVEQLWTNFELKVFSGNYNHSDLNLPSTVLTTHLPISTSSCVIPKENSELFRVTDTLNYPYSGSCIQPEIPDTLTTEFADCNAKSRNIFDQKISSTKCLKIIDYTNDQNYHQQSLASAYFPQVSL